MSALQDPQLAAALDRLPQQEILSNGLCTYIFTQSDR
jgi:hypothetical protein